MKPEPLTEEIESLIVSDIEQTRDDIKSGHAFIESYDDVLDILKKTLPQKVLTIVKHRVQWLLKEIEKMEKELRPTIPATYEDGFYNCLCVVKTLIKKAFSGVVEE